MSSNPIINVQRRVKAAGVPAPSTLRAWTLAALEGAAPGEITIRVVAEDESAELNGKFRHKPYATNVLSFPAAEPEHLAAAPLLGDVILAYETTVRGAEEERRSFTDPATHLVLHGFLHLLGHDHVGRSQAERMEALETRILARLGIADPYLGSVPEDEALR